jgi:hypothetical protein
MPAKAGIQYAAASRLSTAASGILDHPLAAFAQTSAALNRKPGEALA